MTDTPSHVFNGIFVIRDQLSRRVSPARKLRRYHSAAKLVARDQRVPPDCRRSRYVDVRNPKQSVKEDRGLLKGDGGAGATVRSVAEAHEAVGRFARFDDATGVDLEWAGAGHRRFSIRRTDGHPH